MLTLFCLFISHLEYSDGQFYFAIKVKLTLSPSSFALKYISACTCAKAFSLATCPLLITQWGEETKADPFLRNMGFHGQLILAQKIFDIFSRYSLDLHGPTFSSCLLHLLWGLLVHIAFPGCFPILFHSVISLTKPLGI